jgi:hypothetical protein
VSTPSRASSARRADADARANMSIASTVGRARDARGDVCGDDGDRSPRARDLRRAATRDGREDEARGREDEARGREDEAAM